MKIYLTFLLLVVKGLSFAQFTDDFTDGDFTNSPTWSGQTVNFEVDGLNQLHLIAPAVTDTSYLSLLSGSIDNASWEFYVELDFNPSGSNLARIYLSSDNSDLKASLNGYFVQVGNTADEVSLYRQDGLTKTEIIDGLDGTVNIALVTVRIQVTRDAVGNWELLIDNTGGTTFISEGTVFDNTYISSTYAGVFCKYTSTRSDKFYYDDFIVTGTPFVDSDPPLVNSVTIISATELDVQFNEDMNQAIAETVVNYTVDGGIGAPSGSILDGSDASLVHLTFGTPFTNGNTYNLTINNVEDLAGNPIVTAIENFLYFVPDIASPNDVIITEIIGDPNPVIGLPEVDFIEIYNRSSKFFDLTNWTIEDEVSGLQTIGSYVLQPNSYVVLCIDDSITAFGIPNIIGIPSFPGFNIAGDAVVIKDDLGLVIDSVYYSSDWYNDPLKDDGGWTLERKHLDAPCSDQSNWGASIDPSGGTPGIQNSIWTDVDDLTLPEIQSFFVASDTAVFISFNEILDTSIAANLTISPSIPLSWQWLDLNYLYINLNAMLSSTVYNVTISLASDCWGNQMNSTMIKIGLPDSAEQEDIIINEIMFNPLTNGSDYVEIYNNSDKIFDLSDLFLADWDDDSIGNYKSIISSQRLIFPEEYVLITEDTNDIINDFMIYGLGTFIETDIPTYNNDSGSVYLLSPDFLVIDYFHFDEDFHFDLLSDEDGKSLERITFGGGMNNPDNWHTAAEVVEWGTPGYENSQLYFPELTGTVTLDPQLFSPDNDGYNDVLTITLSFTTTENIVDIRIFDNRGRVIRQLKDNYFVGNDAIVTWDGISDEGGKAPIGTYIILVSVLDENGDQKEYKQVCVLGGNL